MGQVSSTYHLVCMWRVEMKREKSMKGEGSNEREGSEICKRKHYSNLNHICNHFQSIYTRTYILGLCQGQIYIDNSILFLFEIIF